MVTWHAFKEQLLWSLENLSDHQHPKFVGQCHMLYLTCKVQMHTYDNDNVFFTNVHFIHSGPHNEDQSSSSTPDEQLNLGKNPLNKGP